MSATEEQKILIYNTMTRRKEEFRPVDEGKVRMYVCGPTVYNLIHIGNARPLVVFDTIRRYFEYLGYGVTFVQNVTDIDDKIIKRANEEGISADEVARKYYKEFSKDREALGVKAPDNEPKATEYIDRMIDLIGALIEKGFAYDVEGNVFFEAGKYDRYGRLSKKDFSRMEIGERVEESIQSQKRDPVRDFALWKAAKPGEPAWESPWGQGRPGWHTECVVMSTDILGSEFDIHGGGVDLVFPHHENEIAQAACAQNAPFANYWMHNEFVNIREEKMAKSLGNVVLVHELAEEFSTEAIRLFFHQTHYRKVISFDRKLLEGAESAVKGFNRFLQEAEAAIPERSGCTLPESADDPAVAEPVRKCWQNVEAAMNDDFNTAKAVGEIFNLVKTTRNLLTHRQISEVDKKTVGQAWKLLLRFNGFLGIIPERDAGEIDTGKIESLIRKRTAARENRDWEEADRIRDELQEMGIVLEDTKDGTKWHRSR